MSALLALTWLLLAGLPPAGSQAADPGTRTAFEEAAAHLTELDYGDVLYARWGAAGAAGAPRSGAEREVLAALLGREEPLPEVLDLLGHDEPRVRGLALLELFDREDPRLLPHLVRLARDEGEAVPQTSHYASTLVREGTDWKRVPAQPPPPEPRTVGQVAQQLVDFYLVRAGFHYGLEGYRDHPGWNVYWAERSERSSCASWLLVLQERAWGGVSPLSPASRPGLGAVRALVDALPTGERELVLLWLPDLEGAFSTEVERLAAARALGRERLLDLLRREPPTDDPDLVPRGDANAGRYPLEDVARFVLEHADVLLAPEDVPLLLELEAAEQARAAAGDAWPMNTALWRSAAARLDVERAREHLDSAWETYQEGDWPQAALDRTALLLAAWRLLGEGADGWVVERFWSQTQRERYWPYALTALVDALASDGSDRARATLAALLRAPGFQDCEWTLLEHLARRIDAWCEPDVIGEGELRRARHPLGAGSLSTAEQRARASEQHPDATRALLEQLATLARTSARQRAALGAPLPMRAGPARRCARSPLDGTGPRRRVSGCRASTS